MKNLKYNVIAKITAFILCIFVFIITAFMAVSSVSLILISDGSNSPNIAQDALAQYYLNSRSNQLFYNFIDDVVNNDNVYEFEKWIQNEDYYFTISDIKENVLYSNYQGQDYKYFHRNYECHDYYDYEKVDYICEEFYIDTFLKTEGIKNELYLKASNYIDTVFKLRFQLIIYSFIGILFIILLTIFLCSAIGHKKDYNGIYINLVNRIPIDIFTAICLLLIQAEILLMNNVLFDISLFTEILIVLLFIIADFSLSLYFLISICARVKAKTLIKNSLIYVIVKYIVLFLKKIIYLAFKYIKSIIKNIPLIPKTFAVIIGIIIINLFLLSLWNEYDAIMLFIIECIIFVPILIYIAFCLKKLQTAGQRIANGDLEHKVDTSFMIGEIKEYGESLNNIGAGLQIAVNEKMKSERLKTELITNVSHDIKTPLTSIINYVDLIKKEKPENEVVSGYIDVLDRQSSRLKKLIEDLIEASKAQTGNLTVERVPCELGILLSQTVGEYDERAKKNRLDIIVNQPTEQISVLADRKHLWRIFDNLMNNICKYSQADTRVYLSLQKINERAVITFKNISKNELNISGEELTERFVRGDSSRNTEGSGLGLSIAKSLVELQGGKFEIVVDGDLFKVIISFNIKE